MIMQDLQSKIIKNSYHEAVKNEKYQCNICKKNFKGEEYIRKHFMTKHSDKVAHLVRWEDDEEKGGGGGDDTSITSHSEIKSLFQDRFKQNWKQDTWIFKIDLGYQKENKDTNDGDEIRDSERDREREQIKGRRQIYNDDDGGGGGNLRGRRHNRRGQVFSDGGRYRDLDADAAFSTETASNLSTLPVYAFATGGGENEDRDGVLGGVVPSWKKAKAPSNNTNIEYDIPDFFKLDY
jgi:hypothetical protein